MKIIFLVSKLADPTVGNRPRHSALGRAIRDRFLAWQCRIRQTAMREAGGRPSPGMRPRVLDTAGRDFATALTVLLIPKEPEESTAFFNFQVMRSPDPRDLYERGLAISRPITSRHPRASVTG